MLFGRVDQYAVGVGEVEFPALAPLEEVEPRPTFLAGADGKATQMRVVLTDGLESLLERGEAFDLEAQVIRPRPRNATAFVVANVPGHEHQRHAAVGELIRIGALALEELQSEDVRVELRELLRMERADREMA